MRNGAIAMLLTSSLTGIAQNPVSRSIESLFSVTDLPGNSATCFRHHQPATGAVRRLANEAADCGLLSSDLAAGIRRVKGVKKQGVCLGNWLTAEKSQDLWQAPDNQCIKGKRDRALLALLLACGLRRHETVSLRLDHLQQREEHWGIVDLLGKGGHIRTVPIPEWVVAELNEWLRAAEIDRGRIFRKVTKMGRIWGDGMTERQPGTS